MPLCLIQVISDITISKGFVAHQLPLIILGNLIFSLPVIFLSRLILERMPNNLQHLCDRLSEKIQPVSLRIKFAR